MDQISASIILDTAIAKISNHNYNDLALPKFIEAFTYFNTKNPLVLEEEHYPFMEDLVQLIKSDSELQIRIARYYGVRVDDVCYEETLDSRNPNFNNYSVVLGNLYLDDLSNVNFRELMYVEGNLTIKNSDNIRFEKMSDVGNNLEVASSSKVEMPEIFHIGNNFKVDSSEIADLPYLEDVDGDFVIEDSPVIDCPKLDVVGGELTCSDEQKKAFVNLKRVNKKNITNIRL